MDYALAPIARGQVVDIHSYLVLFSELVMEVGYDFELSWHADTRLAS